MWRGKGRERQEKKKRARRKRGSRGQHWRHLDSDWILGVRSGVGSLLTYLHLYTQGEGEGEEEVPFKSAELGDKTNKQ